MTRTLTVTMALLTCLAAVPLQAQVTRLVPLPASSPRESAAATPRPAAVSTSTTVRQMVVARAPVDAQRPIDVTRDPYREMQAAYQPTSPADVPPSLLPTTPPSSSAIIQPGSPPVNYAQPGCAQPAAAPPAAAQSYQQPAVVQYTYPATQYVQGYTPIGAVVQTPASAVTQSVPVAQVGLRPLVPASPPRSYYVTNGLLGQPVIYVPGQPVRNFFRYFSP